MESVASQKHDLAAGPPDYHRGQIREFQYEGNETATSLENIVTKENGSSSPGNDINVKEMQRVTDSFLVEIETSQRH